MTKIEKLTEAQKAKFPEYVKKWTELGLSTQPANREKAEEGIRLAYKIAGKKEPRIVWTQSPLGSALTRHVCQQLTKEDAQKILGDSVWASVRDSVWDSVRDSVWDSVWDSVGDSVGASVRDSVWASVWDSVWDSVGDSVGDSVWASVWDSVWASVRDSVGDSVWDSVRDSVGDSVWDSVWASGYGQHDATASAYFSYFREVLGLTEQTEKWEGNRIISENAGWYLPHENICWVCERHSTLKTDDRGRLHCENGPALEYPDGWGIYKWHGTTVPEEWIKDKNSLTPEIALTWTNAEQRRCAMEIIGWEKLLDKMGAKLIDKDEDDTVGQLYEVNHEALGGKSKFLRMYCPTGRWFAEPVPPEMKTALEANAWGWGLPAEIYKPRIQA